MDYRLSARTGGPAQWWVFFGEMAGTGATISPGAPIALAACPQGCRGGTINRTAAMNSRHNKAFRCQPLMTRQLRLFVNTLRHCCEKFFPLGTLPMGSCTG